MAPPKKTEKTEESKKKKSVKEIHRELKAKYGSNVVQWLGEAPPPIKDALRSGSLTLDTALGGGYAKGRIVELAGHESGGKSLLAMSACAEAQRAGLTAVYIDAEHALSVDFARAIGVNVDTLIHLQPDSAEEILDIVAQMARDGVDIIVVDSVAAMVPAKVLDLAAGDPTVGIKAKLLSEELPKIATLAARSGSVVIFINQIREKIGVMFGNPETTPGGRALKFASSVRIFVNRKEKIKDGDKVIGIVTKARIVKNKIAPADRDALISIYFDRGIDKVDELADLAFSRRVLTARGSGGVMFGEEKIAPRKDAVPDALRASKDLFDRILSAVDASAGAPSVELKSADEGEELED